MAKQQKETSDIQLLSVEELEPNRGQIYGLPKNPRFIKDDRFNALKKSLSELPEMTKFRPCIVYPADNGKYVVIAGNMRFRAAVDLGWKQINAMILPKETPVAKLRAITIKDNVAFGSTDWDIIANEWDIDELKDFGMDDGFLSGNLSIDDFFNDEQLGEDSDDEKDGVISVNVPAQYSLDVLRDKIKAAISEFPGCEVK